MKLEKRSEGGPVEPAEDAPKGKKPVVVYIMVLFIAAFLLMAWSFASHQRSNTEALGRLQNSVGAMQEVQDLQNQVIQLQRELDETKGYLSDMEDQFEGANDAANLAQHHLERTQEAMEWFWQLYGNYLQENLDMCETILTEMEKNEESPLKDYLTPLAADRYQEIKETLEASTAETGTN